jgi:hypothetical protein
MKLRFIVPTLLFFSGCAADIRTMNPDFHHRQVGDLENIERITQDYFPAPYDVLVYFTFDLKNQKIIAIDSMEGISFHLRKNYNWQRKDLKEGAWDRVLDDKTTKIRQQNWQEIHKKTRRLSKIASEYQIATHYP